MKKLSPLQAIRLKCKESCCCGDRNNWVHCQAEDTCPLWAFRFGTKSGMKKNKSSKKAPLLQGKKTPDSPSLSTNAKPTEAGDIQEVENGKD